MTEIATLAGGCFWCTEAIFQRLKGVIKVTPGYSGGDMENPSYEDVSSSTTGHAEAIQIEFDPKIISYETILDVFWHTHDPTTLDRQGADVGEQYRSVVFYHDEGQKKIAEESRDKAQKDYDQKIVTEVVPFKNFFEAEGYHHDYYNKNKGASYCRAVIDPKIKKLFKNYSSIIQK